MARPLLERKRDLIYLIFFVIHLPVMFVVDITPLYPAALKPDFIVAIRDWYIATYRDRFFIAPTAWFNVYIWMEAIYHIPISVWAVGALVRDDPRVPLHLLVFACQAGITTLTCIAEYLSWQGYSIEDKIKLGQLYVPYLALSIFMGVDMFGRLGYIVSRSAMASDSRRKKVI